MRIVLVGAELEESLAIRYLWGALRAAGHDVSLIVFNDPAGLEKAAARLAASDAPLTGMSLVFTRRAREFAALATRARELGYRGHVIVGGHFAAFNAEALLRDVPAIDSVAIGEGEAILTDLAAHIDEPARVPGLVFRDGGGGIVQNPAAPKPPDLDALAWPERKRPFDEYLRLPIVNMLGSRGCSHACDFCSIAAWHRMCGGARLRLRAPERIAEEMAALVAEGVRVFNFHDDNFVLPNRRLMFERIDRLEAALRAHGVRDIAFAIKARPDDVDRELLERLVSVGLFRVFLGIEAGTEESLERLGRGQSLADNERALAVCRELDLHACFNLLMWNPGSTLEDVADNVAFLARWPHNPMNFCRTEIYAGTPLERRLRERGALLGAYWGYDYRIEDPRAQASFALAFEAFEERCFGDASVHHSAMRLDYEYHLLARFFGPDAGLRRAVKAFTRRVNLDTAGHLLEIVDGVRAGETGRAFGARMRERVRARDGELEAEAHELLASIEDALSRPSSASAWRSSIAQRAAAAGIAAVLSLGTASCGEEDSRTHPTETVPVPTEPIVPPEIPELPEPPHAPDEPAIPTGDPALIRRQFDREALPFLARQIRPPRAGKVELTLDAEGRVIDAAVLVEDLDAEAESRIVQHLRQLTFRGQDVAGRRFTIRLTEGDLSVQRPHATERVPRPHPTEMIPRPHPTEMAPPPFYAEMAHKPSGSGGDGGKDE